MSAVIEIVGPSAIGKTTVYSALTNAWKKSDRWAPAEYHLAQPTGSGSMIDRIKSWERFRRLAPQPARLADAEVRFLKRFPQFTSAAWNLIHNNANDESPFTDRRLLAAYWFMNSIRKLQAIAECELSTAAVLQEGLISKVMHLRNASCNPSHIQSYVDAMPAPALVLNLTASAEMIRRRAVARERISTVYEDLSEFEMHQKIVLHQQLIRLTTEGLRRRGVKVFDVDAEMNCDVLVNQIVQILQMEL